MTAVATTEQSRQKLPVTTGGKIAAMIPTDIDQAYRMAQALAGSNMTPKAFNNDPNKILVGIIAGMEVGLAPFQALQSIAVINGNPSLWGDGALALIQGSGLLIDIEETDDGETATCRLVRKDRETPIIRSFSNAMAKQAGLLGKTGPWTQYQSRMRQMRARSWAMRDGFPDVLKGIGIAEEVRDFPAETQADVAPRLTRTALANHADGIDDAIDAEIEPVIEPGQGRTDEQHGNQFDGSSENEVRDELSATQTNTPQPSTSPLIDEPVAAAGRSDDAAKQTVEVAASSLPELWKQLVARAGAATSIAQVASVKEEFDAREVEIPLDRLSELQDAIDAAIARFNEGE